MALFKLHSLWSGAHLIKCPVIRPFGERLLHNLSANTCDKVPSPSGVAPIVIMHGLFGTKKNWGSICKALNAYSSPIRKVHFYNYIISFGVLFELFFCCWSRAGDCNRRTQPRRQSPCELAHLRRLGAGCPRLLASARHTKGCGDRPQYGWSGNDDFCLQIRKITLT